MKVAGKSVSSGVGVFFIAFALVVAVVFMPGAKESASPLLYICVLGGLFVGIPAVLGIAVLYENLHGPNGTRKQR